MKRDVKTAFLGLIVGLANLLPGISGGTIVFISGEYGKFVSSLGDLFRMRLDKDEVRFLIDLGLGVAVAILVFSKLIDSLNTTHPMELLSFFSGLIMGGLMSMGMGLDLSPRSVAFLGLGSVLMLMLEFSKGANLRPDVLGLVSGGAIAGATMILPGVSGSAMLVILGLYDDVIGAVSRMEMGKITIFSLGVLLGIGAVSLALKSLVESHENETMSFLFGITLVGLIFLLMNRISLLYLVLGIVSATLLERVMKA